MSIVVNKPVFVDIIERAKTEGMVREATEKGIQTLDFDNEYVSAKPGQLQEVANFIGAWTNIKQAGKDLAGAFSDVLNLPAAVVEVVAGGIMAVADGAGALKDGGDIVVNKHMQGVFNSARRRARDELGMSPEDKKTLENDINDLEKNLSQLGSRDLRMLGEGLARGVVAAPYYFAADVVSMAKNLLVDAPILAVSGAVIGGSRGIFFVVETAVAKFLKGVGYIGKGISWVGQKLAAGGDATTRGTNKAHDALMTDAFDLYNKTYEAKVPA